MDRINAPISTVRWRFDDLIRSGNHGPAGAAGALLPTGVGGLNQFGTYSRPGDSTARSSGRRSPSLQVYADGLWAGYRNRSSTAFLINDAFSGTGFANVKTDSNCDDYLVNGAGFNGSATDPGFPAWSICATRIRSPHITATASPAIRRTISSTNDYILGGGVKV